MDFDKERELENAGICPADFRIMDENERREALENAGLDAETLIDADLDSEFDAWENLQGASLSLSELDAMSEEEKRQALRDADLDPDDYDEVISYPNSYVASSQPTDSPTTSAKPNNTKGNAAKPETYRFCSVTFLSSYTPYSYRLEGQEVHVGDYVLVPTGPTNRETMARVVSVGRYRAEVVPYPVDKAKFIIRKLTEEEFTEQLEKAKAREKAHIEATQQPMRGYDSNDNVITPEQPKNEQTVQSESQEKKPAKAEENSQSTLAEDLKKKNRRLTATVALLTVAVVLLLFAVGYLYWASQNAVGSAISSPSPAPTLVITPRPTVKPSVTPRPTVKPTSTPTPRPVTTPRPTAKPKATSKPSDPFNAKDYSHPDDFYYDYYDDFWDFEDAEDYWEAHH